MARKRLTPAQAFGLGGDAPAPETKALFGPPIARVAGQAAQEAALDELVQDIRRARDEGRLVQALPLDAVDPGYLMRDRIALDEAEMEPLVASLRARGQQVPVEVVDLGGRRYGLISGWRRLQALQRLSQETDDPRFATIQALLRRPESAADAYRAMVEENEIRAGLSYYERARIVARAAGEGVYPDRAAALQGLFGNASRAKRSKIGSFMRICDALDDRLRFAQAIPERLGLALSRAIETDPDFAARLRDRLRKAAVDDAGAELGLIEKALGPAGGRSAVSGQDGPSAGTEAASATEAAPVAAAGLRLEQRPGRVVLEGPAVTEDFLRRLALWLRSEGKM